MRHRAPGPVLVAALAMLAALRAHPEGGPAPEEWAVPAPLAVRSLLLDAAFADGLIVAVGERGHIVRSTDGGKSWVQVPVPTRSMLTGVHLHDAKLGWAVGHDAVILRTEDGGLSWSRVHWAPEDERPLLDVWFRDARRGYAVGAYGLLLTTADGGTTWTEGRVSSDDFHLNDLAAGEGDRLYLAAEAGAFYRSDDAGETWRALPTDYAGSFFGVLPLGGESLLLFGLRGHLFRSDDGGASWTPFEVDTEASLTSGVVRRDGSVVVAGLAGTVLLSRDAGRTFDLHELPDRLGTSTVVETPDGTVLLVGEGGARRFERTEP